MTVPTFVLLVFLVLDVLLTVLVHNRGVKSGRALGYLEATRYIDVLMGTFRADPEGLGRSVWTKMLVDGHRQKMVSEIIEWSDLHEDDRRLIMRAADGAYALMDSTYRRKCGCDVGPAGDTHDALTIMEKFVKGDKP